MPTNDEADYDALMPPRAHDVRVSKAFGRVLRMARLRQGTSRAAVGRRAGIGLDTISRIERGTREPSLSVLLNLAAAVEMGITDLMAALVAELASTPPSVAVAYVVRDGQLLMIRRRFREGTLDWATPGGSLRPEEQAMAAAERETREETGVEVEPVSILGDRVHPATGRHLIYVVCRYLGGEARIMDHEEITAAEWVPIAEALRRWDNLKGGVFPTVRAYLTAALEAQA